MYKVNIYYGGEKPDETKVCSTLLGATLLASQGEHHEIIDLKTNELIEI